MIYLGDKWYGYAGIEVRAGLMMPSLKPRSAHHPHPFFAATTGHPARAAFAAVKFTEAEYEAQHEVPAEPVCTRIGN